MLYEIQEHKHRYAAWAASRAASTKTCRFNVLQGKTIIEEIGLQDLLDRPDMLPDPLHVDSVHRGWREVSMQSAARMNLIGFGHGVAAKLINVYLKGAFVCGGHEKHPSVAALHPPIDSLLLDSLEEKDKGVRQAVWRKAKKAKWSKFNSAQYEEVIEAIRSLQAGKPLWQVEEHWRGYQ
jgi:hypothetical protein